MFEPQGSAGTRNLTNSIGKIPSIIFGGFEFPLPTVKKKYDSLIIGDVHIPVEVT